ncbi:MAG TPA: GNAT family N-acetyltransferase [Beijerinckiaceae bacterium]|nr:GNAT family N-acetyltransferase [Beijerinckiaceae bacterium]
MTARLRPFLPADAAALADLFRASIEILAEEDYSDAQREAWASAADDVDDFGKWLAGMLTLVVEDDSGLVGFGALEDNTMIALLYTRPDFARRGVATLLCDALERLAAARGTSLLYTDASDTSQAFFANRGYTPFKRNSVMRAGEWLANTTMQKKLAPLRPQGAA